MSAIAARLEITMLRQRFLARARAVALTIAESCEGVMRAPRYVDLIRRGELNPAPRIQRAMETPAAVVLDCDRAAGAVAMMEGTAQAVPLMSGITDRPFKPNGRITLSIIKLARAM